ncbi:alpha/beta fold hydrolase [Leptobacterium flavescens]|uniref:Alpha/beta fold hydrolase n=1 Tax=Leptobacterium flavescens TaxID=472055 RepID=A0A6P0UQ31_9FLAO|nr:alpha/beta hydrolase [Leptobacterium flavescens]NER15067.1 alpha/beta fold hydrolase [Leptobacterium flavescens]
MSTNIFSQAPKKSESALVNGKKIYYEVYGKGESLLLLHGYSMSSKSWKSYVSDFEKEYEVYLIDLTGHGRSEVFKEDLSIKAVAEDLNFLIQYLKLEKVKAIGFSFGGDVLYQLALINPALIESMVTIGAVGTWNVNDFPHYLETYTYENLDDFPWLKELHASDAHIRGILHQFQNYVVYLSDKEIQQIQAEVLIMMGDDDEGMDFDEVARLKKNLSNSDIWILPDVSHGAHEGENKEEFVLKAKKFLAKKPKTDGE